MHFINTYYEMCRERCGKIEAIAGKWLFEDLIPGLSDFDTRFICADDTTAEDFCKMSAAVGDVHLELCRAYPGWVRVLEHLPGVNPTWEELTGDDAYYPEYNQWSFYRTAAPEKLEHARRVLSERVWDTRDEYFHLNKFFSYYGPYDRKIDPPINLGAFESKYPLHSRIMHYFNPPVQSAVSLLQKRHIAGKHEAFRIARTILPGTSVWDEIDEALSLHYETPALYEEPEVTAFEARMKNALDSFFEMLRPEITILQSDEIKSAEVIKKELAQLQISPKLRIFQSSRFCRLFKGRMNFYANAPQHFDAGWLINHELNRMGNMFYRIPFKIFWELYSGESVDDPDAILPELVPWLLSGADEKALLYYSSLTPRKSGIQDQLSDCREVAGIFDTVFHCLERIKARV